MDTRRKTMLRSTKGMLDYKILATNGEIGHVSDLLIDDESLKLRYLIDTGGWLSGRRVLLATPWISSVHPERKTVVVNIEKKRIEESPVYDPSAFDRGYELALHQYYGFPYAWPN